MSTEQRCETKRVDHISFTRPVRRAGAGDRLSYAEHAIEITYGYSKEHRPNPKQVVVSLITGHRSQLPVWMEALSGNSSNLARQTFNCQEDAQAALAAFQKRWKYHQAEALITSLARYSGPGRPAAGATPDVVGYRLQGGASQSDAALETARDSLGRFVLATNELDPDKLPPQAMLSQYKAQAISAERGFRFLKDPLFFADSLFLKNPGRIMALIMIMVLALLVYALAERQLRLRLAQEGQSVPNQVGKAIQTPTMRWIFQLFEGIDLLIVRQNGEILNRQVLNRRPEHLTMLHLLGPPVQNCYLLTS